MYSLTNISVWSPQSLLDSEFHWEQCSECLHILNQPNSSFDKCICLNCKMHFSKWQNIFVQFAKYICVESLTDPEFHQENSVCTFLTDPPSQTQTQERRKITIIPCIALTYILQKLHPKFQIKNSFSSEFPRSKTGTVINTPAVSGCQSVNLQMMYQHSS